MTDYLKQHQYLRVHQVFGAAILNRPCKVYQALDLPPNSVAIIAVTVSVPFYWPNSLVLRLFYASQGLPMEEHLKKLPVIWRHFAMRHD